MKSLSECVYTMDDANGSLFGVFRNIDSDLESSRAGARDNTSFVLA